MVCATEVFQSHHGSHTSANPSASSLNSATRPVPTCPSATAVHTAPAAAVLNSPVLASFHSTSARSFARSTRAVATWLLVSSSSRTAWWSPRARAALMDSVRSRCEARSAEACHTSAIPAPR